MRIPTGGGDIDGYLSVPQPAVAGPAPWPGVVVVHDALGLSDDIRAITDRFGTAGYVAVAPDLYSHGSRLRCIQAAFAQMRAGEGRAFDEIDAARRALMDRADCSGRVGVVGFCLGGGFALVAAGGGFQASAPYYGDLPRDPARLDHACPIVASYGRKDPVLKGAAAELEALLTERGIPHDVQEYPAARHSFANRLNLGPFTPVMRIAGFGYHHASGEHAWRRVLAFFEVHLAGGSPPREPAR